MDNPEPLAELSLTASSVADDLGFVALSDISQLLDSLGERRDARLIGGHMVSIHVQRWRLGPELFRETQDADLGVPPIVIKRSHLIPFLENLGYEKISGNTFARSLDDIPVAVRGADESKFTALIDILVPAYTSRARSNVKAGDLRTTEVQGLAQALARPPVEVTLRLIRLNGQQLEATVAIADEISALMLKAFVWARRGLAKDAVDLFRCLEVAAMARVSSNEFADAPSKRAARIIREGFVKPGSALEMLTRGLGPEPADERRVRATALASRIVGNGESD